MTERALGAIFEVSNTLGAQRAVSGERGHVEQGSGLFERVEVGGGIRLSGIGVEDLAREPLLARLGGEIE